MASGSPAKKAAPRKARRAAAKRKPKKRLRHVKTVMQHTLVLDDGQTLTEFTGEPVTVSADKWDEYVNGGFERGVRDAEKNLRDA
jgi:hypothetical protein